MIFTASKLHQGSNGIQPRPPFLGVLGSVVLFFVGVRLLCSHMPKRNKAKEKRPHVLERVRCEGTLRLLHSPSMEKTPILDSRKSNRVLGPDGLPPVPSSSSSFLDRPLPFPLPVKNPKQIVIKALINKRGAQFHPGGFWVGLMRLSNKSVLLSLFRPNLNGFYFYLKWEIMWGAIHTSSR